LTDNKNKVLFIDQSVDNKYITITVWNQNAHSSNATQTEDTTS